MLIVVCQNGYLTSSDTGKTQFGSSKQGFPYTILSLLLPRYHLSPHVPSPGNWDSWYSSNFPNSCMLTLLKLCIC